MPAAKRHYIQCYLDNLSDLDSVRVAINKSRSTYDFAALWSHGNVGGAQRHFKMGKRKGIAHVT